MKPEAPRAPTLGVGLDDEPLAVGSELRLHLGNRTGHRDDPAWLVHIAQPQLDQLASAQPGLDRGLDEQLSGRGLQGRVQPVELLRRQDAVLLDRHGRRLHTPAWVQSDHKVVERAVVKAADSTILLCRIVAGETPAAASALTH